MQPECPHRQSISGVFSIASHSVLQYLPDVVTHEQTGWAHFSTFAVVISSPLDSDQQRMIPGNILGIADRRFCTERDTFRFEAQISACHRESLTRNGTVFLSEQLGPFRAGRAPSSAALTDIGVCH